MPRTNFNMEDPAKQEAVRRKTHEYRDSEGRHGTYVEVPYFHQEYPKQMLQIAKPERRAFKSDEEFAQVVSDQEREIAQSIVKNEAEEAAWLKAHRPEDTISSEHEAPAQKVPARRRARAKAA